MPVMESARKCRGRSPNLDYQFIQPGYKKYDSKHLRVHGRIQAAGRNSPCHYRKHELQELAGSPFMEGNICKVGVGMRVSFR